MEDFLRIVEETLTTLSAFNIDAEKLKFFNTKLKIWDYSGLSFADYQKLLIDKRSSILRKCYSDMCKRYSIGVGSGIFCLIFWFFIRPVWCVFSTKFAVTMFLTCFRE